MRTFILQWLVESSVLFFRCGLLWSADRAPAREAPACAGASILLLSCAPLAHLLEEGTPITRVEGSSFACSCPARVSQRLGSLRRVGTRREGVRAFAFAHPLCCLDRSARAHASLGDSSRERKCSMPLHEDPDRPHPTPLRGEGSARPACIQLDSDLWYDQHRYLLLRPDAILPLTAREVMLLSRLLETPHRFLSAALLARA